MTSLREICGEIPVMSIEFLKLELLTDFSSRSIVAREDRTLLRIPLTVPL